MQPRNATAQCNRAMQPRNATAQCNRANNAGEFCFQVRPSFRAQASITKQRSVFRIQRSHFPAQRSRISQQQSARPIQWSDHPAQWSGTLWRGSCLSFQWSGNSGRRSENSPKALSRFEPLQPQDAQVVDNQIGDLEVHGEEPGTNFCFLLCRSCVAFAPF
jgi:hypothetical protein